MRDIMEGSTLESPHGQKITQSDILKDMRVTIIIPTLNEIIGMKAIMPQLKPEWYHQLIILDGGSTDGTAEYAREQGYFVYVQKRPGLRQAFTEVLPYVTGNVILVLSPDGNCRPEDIPVIINKMGEGYEMVIGSRYVKGAKSDDDDWITAFGNWVFAKTINFLYGSKYTDTIVMFRAFKKNLAYELELDKDDGYAIPEKIFRTQISWEALLTIRSAKRKLRVADVPAYEPRRIGGERKLQVWRWGAAYMYQILSEKFFWK